MTSISAIRSTSPPCQHGQYGQADRSPDLDVMPGFQKPPPGFGVVPFFWWLGDPLTKERLGWILKQMAGMGIAGYQINYAHGYRDGPSYGRTYPSDPPLFSDDWWKLTGWFMQEAKKQGSAFSLSDYTLGIQPGLVRGRSAARASGDVRPATRAGQRPSRRGPGHRRHSRPLRGPPSSGRFRVDLNS